MASNYDDGTSGRTLGEGAADGADKGSAGSQVASEVSCGPGVAPSGAGGDGRDGPGFIGLATIGRPAGRAPAAVGALAAAPASLQAAIRKSLGTAVSSAGYSQQAKLTASGAMPRGEFGLSVALSALGTTALVGAPVRNTGTGAAYVFTLRRGTWSQTAVLTASHGAPFDDFGRSVALSARGSTALVGAPGRNKDTGAAYVFTLRRGTWSQTAVLTASHGARLDCSASRWPCPPWAARPWRGRPGATRRPGRRTCSGCGAAPGPRPPSSPPPTRRQATSSGLGGPVRAGQHGPGRGVRPQLGDRGGVRVQAAGRYLVPDRRAHRATRRPATGSGSRWPCPPGQHGPGRGALPQHGAPGPRTCSRCGAASGPGPPSSPPLTGRPATSSGSRWPCPPWAARPWPGRPGAAQYTGAAYVFTLRRGTWSRTAELTASDAAPGDEFGYSVALSALGSTALAGAPVPQYEHRGRLRVRGKPRCLAGAAPIRSPVS